MGLTIKQTAVVQAVFHGQVNAGQIRHWLDTMQQLIDAGTPFYFIATTLPDTGFCEDYRAIQAIWYKQYKAAFRRCCQGLVRIASSEQDRQRLDTPALHAAWGVPYFVTTDPAAGRHWISTRMEAADAC